MLTNIRWVADLDDVQLHAWYKDLGGGGWWLTAGCLTVPFPFCFLFLPVSHLLNTYFYVYNGILSVHKSANDRSISIPVGSGPAPSLTRGFIGGHLTTDHHSRTAERPPFLNPDAFRDEISSVHHGRCVAHGKDGAQHSPGPANSPCLLLEDSIILCASLWTACEDEDAAS